MSDDARRRLEEVGRRPTPAPDPSFADDLEARLLAVARSAVPADEASGRRRGPLPVRSLRRPRPAAAMGILAALLVAAIWLGTRPGTQPGTPTDLELTASANVEVALADGTTLVDPDGLLLPDGAVVRVGPGGSARIGDLVLRPGDVATIVDGQVNLDGRPPTAVLPDESAVPIPETSRPSGPDASPTPPRSAQPASPQPDGTPLATPGGTPSLSPSGSAAPTPTPRPVASASITLRARAVASGEVATTWTAVRGARRYVLVGTSSRTGPAPDPAYPGSAILGTFTSPPSTPLLFKPRDGVAEVRLLVVALGPGGEELARSNIARVLLGG